MSNLLVEESVRMAVEFPPEEGTNQEAVFKILLEKWNSRRTVFFHGPGFLNRKTLLIAGATSKNNRSFITTLIQYGLVMVQSFREAQAPY
ncbi:MAG: hypothetical protein Q4E09_06145 [Eubacteriales bacterium]|nr:hypothetical protein [Eubacteriales bacterium]